MNTLIGDFDFQITISNKLGILKFTLSNDFIIYTDNNCTIGTILGFELNTTYNSNIGTLYEPFS